MESSARGRARQRGSGVAAGWAAQATSPGGGAEPHVKMPSWNFGKETIQT